MRSEEHGLIREEEVYEAVLKGEIIESYKDDQPYPSTYYTERLWLEGRYTQFALIGAQMTYS